jgi:hypothetical protein
MTALGRAPLDAPLLDHARTRRRPRFQPALGCAGSRHVDTHVGDEGIGVVQAGQNDWDRARRLSRGPAAEGAA